MEEETGLWTEICQTLNKNFVDTFGTCKVLPCK